MGFGEREPLPKSPFSLFLPGGRRHNMYNWTHLEALQQERERQMQTLINEYEMNPQSALPAPRPAFRLNALLVLGLARLLSRWLMQR